MGWLVVATLAAVVLLLPGVAHAASDEPPWYLVTRALMTGSSDRSDPPGYEVYSAITLELGAGRQLGRWLGVELDARTESHEIDLTGAEGYRSLGSVEMLPVNLLVHVRPPWWRGVHPYVGAGVNLTVTWEKSGELDSTDLTPSVGPALALGLEVDLSRSVFLNADIRWNTLRTDIEANGARLVRLRLDPLSFGLGVGARF
jgi:outer membrane protein